MSAHWAVIRLCILSLRAPHRNVCQNQLCCFSIPKELLYIFAFPKTLANEVLRSQVPLNSTKIRRIYGMFVSHSKVFIENLTEVCNRALKQGARYKRLVNKIPRKVSSTGNVTLIIKRYRRAKQWGNPWNKDKWGQDVQPHTRVWIGDMWEDV